MRSKQPTIEDIYMADAYLTTPGVQQGLIERAAEGDDDEVITEETDDGQVVYYRTQYGEMMPVGRPAQMAPVGPPGTRPGDVLVAEVGSRNLPEQVYTGRYADTIKPFDPTVRQQLADFLQAGFEKFGMDRFSARKQAQTLMGGESSNLPISLGLADIVPFLGTALQTQEAARMGEQAVESAQQGNIGTAAIQAGGAALGMVPGAMGTVKAARATGRVLAPKANEMLSDYMRRSGMQLELMGYHGTPHRFDKFDSSKIGTGEGAQAYGYGLYFAEKKGVANTYAVNLSNRDAANQGRLNAHANAQRLANIAGDPKAAADDIRFALEADPSNPQKRLLSDTLKFLESGDYKKPLSNSGVVYTVDIPDALVAKMLDFDKPLSKQTPKIQSSLKAVVDGQMGAGTWDEWLKSDPDFRNLHNDLFEDKTPEKISALLRDAGIPGIRYLDEGSKPSNVIDKKLFNLFEKHGDVAKAVDEMMASVYNTPAKKEKMRQEFTRQLESGLTRNLVVFPGGEDQINIIKTERAK